MRFWCSLGIGDICPASTTFYLLLSVPELPRGTVCLSENLYRVTGGLSYASGRFVEQNLKGEN